MAATLALQTHPGSPDHGSMRTHAHVVRAPQASDGTKTRAYRAVAPIRRYDVERLCRLVFITLLICAALVIVVSRVAEPAPPKPESWASVTVSKTATLWALAQDHPIPGLSTADTVALIRESNALQSATIHEGQVLRVPAQLDTAVAIASR